MQGLNPITMQCIYSTPCGWCAKWDKKCDKKIGCDVTAIQSVCKNTKRDEGLSCYKCVHHNTISSVCSDCHPIFKNFVRKED